MASKSQNLSHYDPASVPSGKGKLFGIIVSEWNGDITGKLLSECVATLEKHDTDSANIFIHYVPGAFELPLGAKLLSQRHPLQAIICLGCVIKGETMHDEYISHAVASGLLSLGLELNIPVIFGVLTPNNIAQAMERTDGIHGNKGIEAAITALKMAAF